MSKTDANLINTLTMYLFDQSDATGQCQWGEDASEAFGFHERWYRETPSEEKFSELKFRYGQLLNCDRGDAILSVHMKSGHQLRLLLGEGFEWVRTIKDDIESDSRSTNATLLFEQVLSRLRVGEQVSAKALFIKKANEWNLFKEGNMTLCAVIDCPDDKFTSEYLKLIESELVQKKQYD